MSWFSGTNVSTVELDNKISEATSESIPNGELELSVALEITDLIRSKKIPAKQCMRALKKRLTLIYTNPNLLSSTVKLTDLCVKNSGYHFLVEIASKEFMDYLVDFIFKVHYNTKDYLVINNESKFDVGRLILSLVKEWAIVFENQLQLLYVDKCYKQLLNEGYDFPETAIPSHQLNTRFVDTEVAPDWVDNDSCMICYNAFSVMNRKHHCRACGGVFCQTHSNNYMPLFALGIKDPVRVCDNCSAKYKLKHGKSLSTNSIPKDVNTGNDEDEELKRAIALSLQETGIRESGALHPSQYQRPASPPPAIVQNNEEEEDEDLKAAIAASLLEFKQLEQVFKNDSYQDQNSQTTQPVQPQSDFYNNILPFDPSQQPFQDQQPPQQAFTPAQHIEHHKPQAEDLSPQEEEQISLFITLMNGVKSDPKKQANVMYDSNLSDLHTQVIRLKPKVNKSLRASIEKYECFLEMNNKISTITRLYDQYLEAKLNVAYGNHQISSPGNGQSNYFYPQNSGGYVSQQPTGTFSPHQTGGYNQQTTGGYASQQIGEYSQGSGFNPQRTGGYDTSNPGGLDPVARQSTGYPTENAYVTDDGSRRYSNENQGYKNTPTKNPTEFREEAPPSISAQGTGYPSQPEYPTYPQEPQSNTGDMYGGPSEPAFGDEEDEEVSKQQDQGPPPTTFSYPPSTGFTQQAAYPIDSPASTDNEADRTEVTTQAYPDNGPISRTNTEVQEASVKFPTIESVEQKYATNENNQKYATEFNNMPDLPSLPTFDLEEESDKKKYISEPEPLIEL